MNSRFSPCIKNIAGSQRCQRIAQRPQVSKSVISSQSPRCVSQPAPRSPSTMSREWQRFEPVTRNILTGKRLFRSSAPNYSEDVPKPYDASQKLTVSAVRYLQDKGIVGIISLNAFPYKYSERSLLYSVGIDYKHIPIEDFKAPALDDIDDAWDFFMDHRSTLVHCGYGWGRTGTMITALQLCCTDGRYPASSSEWQGRNHVEKPEQVAVLRELRSDVSRYPKDKYTTERYWKH